MEAGCLNMSSLCAETNSSLDQEIRTTSTRFEVFDRVPIGVCILRQDMTVVYWNSSLTAWSGLSPNQILGQDISRFFPQWQEIKYQDCLKQTFEQGQALVFSCERHPHLIPCPLPNGKLRVQHTTVTAAPNSNRKSFYAVLSIQDVTDLIPQS